MRIIKEGKKGFEVEKTCGSCGTIFAFEYHDVYTHHDIDGGTSQMVECPICGHSMDVRYSEMPNQRKRTFDFD